MTLSQQQGQLSAFVATWTEVANTTGATATATHTGEAGKSHYITGFACSAQGATGADPDEMVFKVEDESGTLIALTFQSVVVNDYAPGTPAIVHALASPLLITAGDDVSVSVSGASTYCQAYVNVWGFTDL
jgi:hypothetical protein